jgi:hypothetical protein
VTDKEIFADRINEHSANDSHHVSPVPNRRRWVTAIFHRWPTWLAIAMAAALTVEGTTVGSSRTPFPCWRSGTLPPPCNASGPRGSWQLASSRRTPL